jgi:hypothetical protein
MTALARASSNSKRQTHRLLKEDVYLKKNIGRGSLFVAKTN